MVPDRVALDIMLTLLERESNTAIFIQQVLYDSSSSKVCVNLRWCLNQHGLWGNILAMQNTEMLKKIEHFGAAFFCFLLEAKAGLESHTKAK